MKRKHIIITTLLLTSAIILTGCDVSHWEVSKSHDYVTFIDSRVEENNFRYMMEEFDDFTIFRASGCFHISGHYKDSDEVVKRDVHYTGHNYTINTHAQGKADIKVNNGKKEVGFVVTITYKEAE